MSKFVLFSGGCDSTLVLYREAMYICRSGTYEQLTAISIEHTQIPAQKEQREARNKIRKEFEKRELNVNWMTVSITQDGSVEGDGLVQPCIWMSTALMYLRSGDTLYTGYHRGDDYWTCKTEIETAINSFSKVLDKKNIQIQYPLELNSKAQIIKELKDRGLYDLCWYCENPHPVLDTYSPCGECTP